MEKPSKPNQNISLSTKLNFAMESDTEHTSIDE